MKVKITRGMYGHYENGNVVEKTADDGPFEVPEAEGKRLIMEGIACGEGETEADTGEESGSGMELELLGINELRGIAGSLGLKKDGGKAELIRKIREVQYGEGEMPQMSPADPE